MAEEPRIVKEITIAFNGDNDYARRGIEARMAEVEALIQKWNDEDRRRPIDLGNAASVAWHSAGDAAVPTVVIAEFETPRYSFVAVGRDEDHAREALALAWIKHAEQTGADRDYLDKFREDICVMVARHGVVFRDRATLLPGDVRVPTDPPAPDSEDDDSDIIDLDRVATRIFNEHGIPAHVEQTGGGVATLYVGCDPSRDLGDNSLFDGSPRMAYSHMAEYMSGTVAIGPGWFEGPGWTNARATTDELSLGPDDQGQGKDFEPTSEDECVALAAEVHKAVMEHINCKPEDHVHDVECHIEGSHDGNSEGRPCNDDQQRHDEQGNMRCNDCGVPLFWCETTRRYHHTEITAAPCFLVSR